MMDYHIPQELPYDLLSSIGVTQIEKIRLDVKNDSIKLECYNNVVKYLKNNDGELQLGWVFRQIGNIVFKLTAHAVVKLSDGSFKCVTPSDYQVTEMNFSPDDDIARLMKNDKLPCKVYSLVDDKVVHEYVRLENMENKMRLEGNEFAVYYVMSERHLMMKKLINVYEKYMKI